MNEIIDNSNVPKVKDPGGFYLGNGITDIDTIDTEIAKPRPLSSSVNKGKNFAFALRGMTLNKIVDCASPLIALIMRISNLGNFDDVEDLHKRCCHEIDAIELELHKFGYDRVTILAFRYCLCSVIDEAVLITPWGENSRWSQNSLLALYHQETWGGEKFFVIVDRLMDEPHRYIDIVEFLYLCMILGYEGKYRPQHNGKLNLETFIKDVHDAIRKERGYPDTLRLFEADHVVIKKHEIKWQTPVIAVVLIALACAILLYFAFFIYTEAYTGSIIRDISGVLAK
ncbi:MULTISPECIES: type IVB secretion system protein IcmH/DotU [unclassified Bartonella]|uniref:type IVB secretion system protein IcmH/DotU n=1 Tax=unclassified Bartonella TaxID=2645622 RepID=UPI0021C6A473|nr:MULTISPECIES: type IVB secretion system protein IcmH/DotU [unclassified Bartonella]UXN05041.1 type IVB secretion system protein IcmH/DotU [Bartonella sp. HY406]UXN08089.1 type IVB secretion system protein IcmH/DotU [Bartonella sp. HY761]